MGEAVRVENFSFRYSEGSKYAVKNFNLRVRERDSDTRGTERMRETHPPPLHKRADPHMYSGSTKVQHRSEA